MSKDDHQQATLLGIYVGSYLKGQNKMNNQLKRYGKENNNQNP
jgi:hypothetical protein